MTLYIYPLLIRVCLRLFHNLRYWYLLFSLFSKGTLFYLKKNLCYPYVTHHLFVTSYMLIKSSLHYCSKIDHKWNFLKIRNQIRSYKQVQSGFSSFQTNTSSTKFLSSWEANPKTIVNGNSVAVCIHWLKALWFKNQKMTIYIYRLTNSVKV